MELMANKKAPKPKKKKMPKPKKSRYGY